MNVAEDPNVKAIIDEKRYTVAAFYQFVSLNNIKHLQAELKKLCQKYKHTVLDKTTKSFVFEVSALKKEIDDLIKKLQPLGLASASRTGVVAMTKGFEIYKQS